MLKVKTTNETEVIETETQAVELGKATIKLVKSKVGGEEKPPQLHASFGKKGVIPLVIPEELWSEFIKWGYRIFDLRQVEFDLRRNCRYEGPAPLEDIGKLAEIAKEYQNAEQFFERVVKENPENLIFFDWCEHRFYIPKEDKWYRTRFIDYIGSNLDESNYDLEAAHKFLKETDNPNIGYVCDQIRQVPGYNAMRGRTRYISFRVWSECDFERQDTWRENNDLLAVLLKDFKKDPPENYGDELEGEWD